MDETPSFALVVIHPFADYQKGQRIADPAEIAKVLDGECAHAVNKVAVDPAAAE